MYLLVLLVVYVDQYEDKVGICRFAHSRMKGLQLDSDDGMVQILEKSRAQHTVSRMVQKRAASNSWSGDEGDSVLLDPT